MPVVPLTDNEFVPEYKKTLLERVRADVAAQDKSRSQARARGRHDKKFPEARDYSWPSPVQGEWYRLTVKHHLGAFALHLLYEAEGTELPRDEWERLAGLPLAAEDLLTAVDDATALRRRVLREGLVEDLVAHVLTEGRDSLYVKSYERRPDTRHLIAYEDVEVMARDSALFALDAYKPIKAQLQAWGKKGGQRSRRGRTKSLDGVEGLSIAEQAEALGVTPRTISRMRADAKKRDEALAPMSDATARSSTEAHYNNDAEVLTDKPSLTDKPEVFDPYDPRCYLKADGSTDWAMLFRAVP
jgi:hypothetical protein